MNEPLQEPTNYNLTLMTLFGVLSGVGLTFLFQDVFTVSLTKALLIAVASSLIWLLFYLIKNYQESVIQAKEVFALLAVFVISGASIWYKMPPLVDFTIPWQLFLIWPISFGLVYKIEAALMAPEGDVDVFHKGTIQHGTDQRIAFHDLPKKQILNEEVAFHIENDGLDLQIIFNIEKTGAPVLIKVDQISDDARFKDYLLKQGITVNELGRVIDGAMLIEIELDESVAYYQVVENFSYGEPELLPAINIALLEDADVLNKAIETALHEMLLDYPAETVKKFNTKNYQAVFKFYDYVKKLNKKENRCIDYISFYHGRFEISNSEYVELYNCNLHSTLISWVNKDGLIRTDYVDEEEELLTPSEKEALQTIVGLPFMQCRLIDIKLLKQSKSSATVKLYMTFAELFNYEPTGKQESLTLSAKGKDILISSEIQEEQNLITIDEYFDAKTLIGFDVEDEESIDQDLEANQLDVNKAVSIAATEIASQVTDIETGSVDDIAPITLESEEDLAASEETDVLLTDLAINDPVTDVEANVDEVITANTLEIEEADVEVDDIKNSDVMAVVETDETDETDEAVTDLEDFSSVDFGLDDPDTETEELDSDESVPLVLEFEEDDVEIDALDSAEFAPLALELEEDIEVGDNEVVGAAIGIEDSMMDIDAFSPIVLEIYELESENKESAKDEFTSLTLGLEEPVMEIGEVNDSELLSLDVELEESVLDIEAVDDSELPSLDLELEEPVLDIEAEDDSEILSLDLELEEPVLDIEAEDESELPSLDLELEELASDIETIDESELPSLDLELEETVLDIEAEDEIELPSLDLELEEPVLDIEAVDDELSSLALELEETALDIEAVDDELSSLTLELEETALDIAAADDEFSSLTLDLEGLSKEINELDDDAIISAEKGLAGLATEIGDVDGNEFASLTFDLEESSKDVEAVDDELSSLTLELEDLSMDINELDGDDIISADKELKDLTTEIDETDDEDFSSLALDLEEMVTKNDQLDREEEKK